MTWPLVILRVNRATYEDIQRRVIAAGQGDRVFSDGRISVDEVAIEIDPNGDIDGAYIPDFNRDDRDALSKLDSAKLTDKPMQTTRTKYQEVRYTHKVRVSRPGEKTLERQKTFYQTLNPFNKTADGRVKVWSDIMKELQAEALEWERSMKSNNTTQT